MTDKETLREICKSWRARIGSTIMHAPNPRFPDCKSLYTISDVVQRFGRVDVTLEPVGGIGAIGVDSKTLEDNTDGQSDGSDGDPAE